MAQIPYVPKDVLDAADEVDQEPKKRRGRKPDSPLVKAARDYENAKATVTKLEKRFANLSEKLADVDAALKDALELRDESWAALQNTKDEVS